MEKVIATTIMKDIEGFDNLKKRETVVDGGVIYQGFIPYGKLQFVAPFNTTLHEMDESSREKFPFQFDSVPEDSLVKNNSGEVFVVGEKELIPFEHGAYEQPWTPCFSTEGFEYLGVRHMKTEEAIQFLCDRKAVVATYHDNTLLFVGGRVLKIGCCWAYKWMSECGFVDDGYIVMGDFEKLCTKYGNEINTILYHFITMA